MFTEGHKVPICATIPVDAEIGWYFDLVAFFPRAAGEVKSSDVLSGFEQLPEHVRDRVWDGLRTASIHLADPGPYRKFLDRAFEKGAGQPFPEQELRAAARSGDAAAARLLAWRDEHSGRLMLLESLPSRLRSVVTSAVGRHWGQGLGRAGINETDLSSFKRGKSSLLRQVAEYSAKGSAAFAEAYELAITPSEAELTLRFAMGPSALDIAGRGTLRALEDGHGFDRGQKKTIDTLEGERQALIRHLVESDFMGVFDESENQTAAFVELDSRADARIQAADVAAGMARAVVEREGYHGVVQRWDRVFLNGSRVTDSNLLTVSRFWERFA